MSFEKKKEIEIFIQNIRWLMERHSLTKQQMAHIMHISPKTLTRLLLGDYSARIRVNVVFYLSSRFGYKPAMLFTPLWKSCDVE